MTFGIRETGFAARPWQWSALFWFGVVTLIVPSMSQSARGTEGATDPSKALPCREIGGVYPHLACFNDENECGIGAVVPWADRLWVITYAPHAPAGSSDKLYEITPELQQQIFSGSIGGTPANRLIHNESNQLFIGPYCIDAQRRVRVIPSRPMFGRLTGTARHLFEPASKVYFATMEEGLYEVDVRTLDVTCLIRDSNSGAPAGGVQSVLPGCHGKGLYTGQARLLYTNNGERHPAVGRDPTIASGALAEWWGAGDWQLVRRNQFTEVTGPGGIQGSASADAPVWALGWDAKSVILGLLEDGEWFYYRLPKGSHSYDGSHGWNTEWPRIRDVGEDFLLATMHGTFWKFPAKFSREHSSGIRPLTNYLKVVGDFCRWQDWIVLGCDDSARSEFMNRRPFKAKGIQPGQSNSNLWFVEPATLGRLGPAIGRGSVWLRDDLAAGSISEPFLFTGYDDRQLTLTHASDAPVRFVLEIDRDGNNAWTTLEEITLAAASTRVWHFSSANNAAWIRLRAIDAGEHVTAHFHYRNRDRRGVANHAMFDGLPREGQKPDRLGLMRSFSVEKLAVVAASSADGSNAAVYEIDQQLTLRPCADAAAVTEQIQDLAQPVAVEMDESSVILSEDGRRFRLPRTGEGPSPQSHGFGRPRVCREVATERDLLNVQGTFYELPARNAGGVAKIRPIATHGLAIHDYCSHNGLLFVTGLDAETTGERIIRSPDGKAAVWVGVVDDLWKLGKPRGQGGPWCRTVVQSGEPSDPYLMTGYDRKLVTMTADKDLTLGLEVDVDGTGLWVPYGVFAVAAGETVQHCFPPGFSSYWIRSTSSRDAEVSVIFTYD